MIAEVTLNVPLLRTFDYTVPQDMAPWVYPGVRVVVPFGGRQVSGMIIAIKEQSAVAPAKLKALARLVEAQPLFGPELLAFTRWVAGYYLCGWGEVLEAALPSGMGVRFDQRYAAKQLPWPAQALAALPSPLRLLLEVPEGFTREQWAKAMAKAEISSDTQAAHDRWLAARLRAGEVVLRRSFVGLRGQRRQEKWLAPGPAFPPEGRQRPNRQRETKADMILRLLRQEGPVPLARLKTLMANPGPAVKPLVAAGALVWQLKAMAPPEPFGPLPPPQDFLPPNPEQSQALEILGHALEAQRYQGFLLDGVTGSGKTEVYLHAVRQTLAQGRTCLLLVPEIALTAQMVDRFRARFGRQVAVLHSGMPEPERQAEWSRVREGQAPIVIGARSALFAPLEHLGLVVVDEEHDASYKQEDTPRYHARDAALVRARNNNAVAVLGSATPSLESLRNVALGKLTRLVLTQRAHGRPLPLVELLNLKVEPRQPGSPLFTKVLVAELRETLLRKEQALLFLNRRGFASLMRCQVCQEEVQCANCSLAMVYHQAADRLVCHRCEHSRPKPKTCPACNSPEMKVLGLGTERIEQELAMMFPQARILRMDSDSLRRKGELGRMLAAIRDRQCDMVIGTQILTKGHDFPHISLVAAIMADVSLNIPDFRSPERTFQLLTQMAGRAGRGLTPGRVLIQTYNPRHHALIHVMGHDTQGFAAQELASREAAQLPPFAHQVILWASSPDEDRARHLARTASNLLRQAAPQGVRVSPAAEAPLKKLHNRYRWMVQILSLNMAPVHALLQHTLPQPTLKTSPQDRLTVDIDAYNSM